MRTDTDLLRGDARGFAAFYRRHEDAVLGFHLKRTGSAELAADLAAETFARALEGRKRFDPRRGDAGAWLFGIARNVLGRSLEQGRVENEVRRRLAMQPLELDDHALARIHELSDEPAQHALGGLPDDQARAVRGRVIDEHGYDELARELRCSESVVRQRVSRGLRALRAELGRDE
ncbi:RNA polymerase sigma-70 factor (ECF subfamily) [Solirubrobacter pauli]|uniref:RNA polymerase sigma-70 factor (ECF subfamily) n=1 Tax=Solirubrobacter pauli TaxID=166793 RepID=A0A660LDH8_9ACTN|nr:RNA polymerase sigma factor [Solirubrobacter pauli]RKQ93072.1 RNA polymerase sigma-70 factor (ECF subfamily) [Solirubrobacter pauli]